jgi:hypothetical protein
LSGGSRHCLPAIGRSSGPGRHYVSLDPRDCPCAWYGWHSDCKHLRTALILENEARGEEKVEITRATLARLMKQQA